MNLVPLLLPIGKQYKLHSSLSLAQCQARLAELFAAGKTREKDRPPLFGKIDENDFQIRAATLRLFSSYRAEFRGKLAAVSAGTDVTLLLAAGPAMRILLNGSANMMIGATVGVMVAAAMLPDAVAICYAFFLLALVPALNLLLGTWLATDAVNHDAKLVLEQVRTHLETDAPAETEPQPEIAKSLLQNSLSIVIGAILFIVLTFNIHGLVWNLWCHGRYLQMDQIVNPIQGVTSRLLGPSSGAAMDCDFYMAQSLRCEGKQLGLAERTYDRVIENLRRSSADRPGFLGDNQYGLARILDEIGHHSEAETEYRNAIASFTKAAQFGPNSAVVAQVYDRLAMLLLKECKFSDAKAAMEHALEIDRAHGEKAARSVAEDLNDLGLVYDKMENIPQAVSCYEQSLKAKRAIHGNAHYSVATTMFNLADMLKAQGKGKASASMAAQAEEIYSNVLSATTGFLSPTSLKIWGHGDPVQQYIELNTRFRFEYEMPRTDVRCDGLRPYLQRY